MLDATCIVVIKNCCANNELEGENLAIINVHSIDNELEGQTKDMVNLHSFNSVFQSNCEIVHQCQTLKSKLPNLYIHEFLHM
jgi:hypothetical protein